MDVTIKIPGWFAAAMINREGFVGLPLPDIVFAYVLQAGEDLVGPRDKDVRDYVIAHYPKLYAAAMADD